MTVHLTAQNLVVKDKSDKVTCILLSFHTGPFIPYTLSVTPTLIGTIGIPGTTTRKIFFTIEGGWPKLLILNLRFL